jgi:excisionase family DNA binding protein
VRSADSRCILLNSWKEIASYLARAVRTVQRWEHDAELPVHRIGRGTRAPVFAFGDELEKWLKKQPCKSVLPTHDKKARFPPGRIR